MKVQELQARIRATKSFLHREIVRNKVNPTESLLSYREIDSRLNMIHEAERVGIRNLGERQNRKLTKMISEIERMGKISLN